MHTFFEYINHSEDNPYVKSAIANYVLSKELGLNHKYFSISSAVIKDKKNYYDALEKTNKILNNKDFDFTAWILWHTSMIDSAIDISLKNIQTVVNKTKFRDRARNLNLNEKHTKVLNKLLDSGEGNFEGGLTNKKYRGITATTQVTASRHIKELVDKGLLQEIEGHGGRSTCYDIVWDR